MEELIQSVKRHGIITPLTLSCDGGGRYAIIAGERRYRAAKAAKLREVPALAREVDGEALTLAVTENVIRADLSPVEEARAYRRLVDEHGDTAKVAKLVGKSERLLADRLDLLRLPDQVQVLLAARKVPLACAPALVRIAEREPRLADLASLWLVQRPHDASAFPAAPGGGRSRRPTRRVDGRWLAGSPRRLQRRRLPRPARAASKRPAVGNELVIGHPTDRLPGKEIAAVVAGPALYLFAHALFRLRMTGTVSWKRLAGAIACVAAGAVGGFAPAVVPAALVVAVLIAVIGAEHVAAARRRACGEPTPLERLADAPELDRAARDQPA